MLYLDENEMAFYTSPDLKTWTEVPLTDIGGGEFEVSVPTAGEKRCFLQLDVMDPN